LPENASMTSLLSLKRQSKSVMFFTVTVVHCASSRKRVSWTLWAWY